MQNRRPIPSEESLPVPHFTPVPRKYRHDGWTEDRQRAFIDALAATGSVRSAARRINMSSEGAYYLRRQPGAEEFAAAWDAALDYGVQQLADIAIDRAREGVPVPIFHKGVQCGERRWYNDKLLIFILKHHMPSRYGADLAARPPSPEERQREVQARIDRAEAHGQAITARMQRLRQHMLREVARHPAKRAAWEVLCGVTDWERVANAKIGEDDGFAECNMTSNSTIALFAALDGRLDVDKEQWAWNLKGEDDEEGSDADHGG